MQVNPILSALLTQPWLIEPQAAEGLLFSYIQFLKGGPEASSLFQVKENKEDKFYAIGFVAGLTGSAAVSTMMKYSVYDDAPAGSIAVHTVEGAMMERDNCGTPGTRTMGQRIQAADAHPNIGAHLVDWNTPGGTVAGTESFGSIIKSTSKPLVSFVRNMNSAGYWSGSNANLIIVGGHTASAGSIGTMITLASFDKAYEEMGVVVHNIRASRSKDKNEAFYQAQQGKYDRLREEALDPINEAFLSVVQENRGDKLDLKKNDVLTGLVYYGQSIIDVGLADEMGNFDYAVRRTLELMDEHSNSNQPNSQNKMAINLFNKYPKLTALAGVAAADIKDDALQAANEELEAAGITGVTVISDAQAEAFQAAAQENATLKADNKKLTESLAASQAEVTRLGKLDGAAATGSAKEGAELKDEEGADENQKAIDALPHNQALANNPLFN